jgi:co-chaperonin GroES (HSP10)
MSELIVPDHIKQAKQDIARDAVEAETEAEKDAKLATQLPIPCGYKILIGLPKIETKYESGILKADATVRNEEVASVVGFVMEMGPDCYKDTTRFPSGPFCKKGDFILLRSYAGNRFKIHGVEFRLISDDMVEAVITDPRGFSRV